MRNIIIPSITLIIILLGVYLTASFANLEMNPFEWTSLSRGIVGTVSFTSLIVNIIWAATFEEPLIEFDEELADDTEELN